MSLSQKFRKSNVILLIVIAAAAAILSIISYQYSTYNANEILKIASDDVRSNSKIQSHYLSTIVEQELDKVTAILKTLSDAPAIHNAEIQRGRDIINLRQETTSDITDGYFWLDKDGKLIWSSKFANNEFLYEQFKDTNLGDQLYFTVPRTTERTYYSSVVESSEGVTKIYISMPIIGEGANNATTTVFKGVIVAGIRTDTLGNFVKNQIPPSFESNIGLVDKNSIILYTTNQTYIGKNYFGGEFQSTLSVLLSPNELAALNDVIKRSLQGSPGTEDIILTGQTTTIAYRPVMITGEHLLTLYTTSPHQLTGSVNLAIDQQTYFNLVIIGSIGALAVGIAFLILTWNKKLGETVNAKTAELRQANEQLKIHDRMQKEFINVAAHELRTPIVPILGYSELLYSKIKGRQQQKGQGQQEEQQEEEKMLETILRNANRLRQLTEDILDVTRIESNTLKLRKERFNLNDVIVDAIEDYREQIANGNVKLMYELGNNNTLVEADRRRVTQVISNLLNNAIKFTKEGTVTVTTTIRRKDVVDRDNRGEGGGRAEEVVIAVKDTGSGIDSELMPRLFTKFATKSYQGTGLGLFIAKSIIEAHGGKIWAENNNNNGSDSDRKHKGATFYFTLPVVAMSEERREEKKEVRLVNDQRQ
ncbi:MAG: sensor histidine kinase [Thermoproteota archaeon]|nr:sensor histidine kinase [Thermoproteota archaeon]